MLTRQTATVFSVLLTSVLLIGCGSLELGPKEDDLMKNLSELHHEAVDPRALVVPVEGAERVAILVTTFAAGSPPAVPVSYAQSLIAPDGPVNRYFAQTSYGKAQVYGDAFGPFVIGQPSGSCTSAMSEAVAQADATVNFANYKDVIVVFPTSSCSYGVAFSQPGGKVNLSTADGTVLVGQSYINGGVNFTAFYVEHELGHAFGLLHGNSFKCTNAAGTKVSYVGSCTSTSYGDPFDVMGVGGQGSSSYSQMNAVHLLKLGWLSPSLIAVPTESAMVQIGPIGLVSTEMKAIKIAHGTTGSNYFFEYRPGLGVLIHHDAISNTGDSQLLDPSPSDSSFYNAFLSISGTTRFEDPEKQIKVTLLAADDNGATLSVELNGQPAPLPPPSIHLEALPGESVGTASVGVSASVVLSGIASCTLNYGDGSNPESCSAAGSTHSHAYTSGTYSLCASVLSTDNRSGQTCTQIDARSGLHVKVAKGSSGAVVIVSNAGSPTTARLSKDGLFTAAASEIPLPMKAGELSHIEIQTVGSRIAFDLKVESDGSLSVTNPSPSDAIEVDTSGIIYDLSSEGPSTTQGSQMQTNLGDQIQGLEISTGCSSNSHTCSEFLTLFGIVLSLLSTRILRKEKKVAL